MRADHWPLFGLRITTPRAELRYPDDDLVHAMVDLVVAGLHDPSTMPFVIPFTDAPSPERERSSVQHFWRLRADWSVSGWMCPFAVLVDGTVVGLQVLEGPRFHDLRAVSSGSWLGRAYQGQGIGTEMRAAMLHFAFDTLGAEYAHSGAWQDNGASLAVSRKLGYVEEGRRREMRRASPDWLVGLRLDRPTWASTRRDDI